MFDRYVRPFIDPPLNRIGKYFAKIGFSANIVTLIGFVFGVIAILMILDHYYKIAAILIGINRLMDGIDGAVARQTQLTDFGGFLDIVCDFIFYSGVVCAFGIADFNRLPYALFLVFSFIGPITTFLAFAVFAEKNKLTSTCRGKKSFYYLGGICEGTETAIALILICLMPNYFNSICMLFGIMCWITTLGRIYIAWVEFGQNSKQNIVCSLKRADHEID